MAGYGWDALFGSCVLETLHKFLSYKELSLRYIKLPRAMSTRVAMCIACLVAFSA